MAKAMTSVLLNHQDLEMARSKGINISALCRDAMSLELHHVVDSRQETEQNLKKKVLELTKEVRIKDQKLKTIAGKFEHLTGEGHPLDSILKKALQCGFCFKNMNGSQKEFIFCSSTEKVHCDSCKLKKHSKSTECQHTDFNHWFGGKNAN